MEMKSLNEIYGARFFARRHRLNWRAPIVCSAIAAILEPSDVIDIGCATGDLVAQYNRMGVPAYGLEGSEECIPFFECEFSKIFIMDLRKPVPKEMTRFDLVTCFEVMEHVEPEFADILVSNLITLSDRLLLSAAPPGQGGHYHVNCRPIEYWHEKFTVHGYTPDPDVVMRIKAAWLPWKDKPGIKAYYQNLLYYEHRE